MCFHCGHSDPTAAEAQRRLLNWGSQMDMLVGLETGPALQYLCLHLTGPVPQGLEVCVAVTSTPIEVQTLNLSSSEELDDVVEAEDTEDSPSQSQAFEELVEVVMRAVKRLSIDWPADK